jgi:hypothetical protein
MNGSPSISYRNEVGEFIGFSVLRGERGSDTHFSEGIPSGSLGRIGDFCYAKIDGEVYLFGAKSITGWPLSGERLSGKSAYEVWLMVGNVGTEQDFINAMKGDKGDTGAKGDNGDTGEQGIQGIQGAKGDKGGTQSAGSIVLRALGDVPAVALPVQIIVRGDL